MSAWQKALALTLLTASSTVYAQCTATSNFVNEDWLDPSNWEPNSCPGGVPGTTPSATDTAILAGTQGPTTISLSDTDPNFQPNLNQLIFNNSTASFTITTSNPSGRINFFSDTTGGNTFIIDQAGTHAINVLVRAQNVPLIINVADPCGQLTLEQGAVVTTGGTQGGFLLFTGPGTVKNLPAPPPNNLLQVSRFIEVIEGKFINNGTVRSPVVNIDPCGTIAGTGLFSTTAPPAHALMTNSGTVAPGDPVGTLTVLGSYTQTSSGTLLINLEGPSSFSMLDVEGSGKFGFANIDGALCTQLVPGGSIQPGQSFDILHALQGVFGTFSKICNSICNVIPCVQYLPNDVILTFFPTLANFAAGFRETLFTAMNEKNFRLERQMEQMRRCFTFKAKETSSVKNEARCHMACSRGEGHPWNFYIGPIGDSGRVYTKELQRGFEYWGAGALAGFDFVFSNIGLGLMLNYEHFKGDGLKNWGDFEIDEAHASVYATYAPERVPGLSVDLAAGGGFDWYEFKRHTGIRNELSAKGEPNGPEYDFLLGIEYTFSSQNSWGCMEFMPLANIQYMHLNIESYKEHSADLFNMKIHEQTYQSLRSTLGARISYTKAWQGIVWTPEIDFGWQREYRDKETDLKFSSICFPTRPECSIEMAGAGRNIGFAGFDILAGFKERYAVEASYDYIWNSLYHDHSFYLGLEAGF